MGINYELCIMNYELKIGRDFQLEIPSDSLVAGAGLEPATFGL